MTYDEFFDIAASQFPVMNYMQRYVKEHGAISMSCKICADGYLEFDARFENDYFCATHTSAVAEDEFCAKHYDTRGEEWKKLEDSYGKFKEWFFDEEDGTVDDIPVQ